MNLNSFLAEQPVSSVTEQPKLTLPLDGAAETDAFAELPDRIIPEGKRNATMSHIAGCLIKRYGDTEQAQTLFSEKAKGCMPRLEKAELEAIWASAVRFGKKLAEQEEAISEVFAEEVPANV